MSPMSVSCEVTFARWEQPYGDAGSDLVIQGLVPQEVMPCFKLGSTMVGSAAG